MRTFVVERAALQEISALQIGRLRHSADIMDFSLSEEQTMTCDMARKCFARLIRGSSSVSSRQFGLQLAELRAEIVAARWLGYRVAWLFDQGKVPTAESSMIKVLTADLLARMADLGTDILGWAGLVRGRDAPLGGRIEFFLRSIWFHLVGGGTPDIQRNVIAQWGLGLPREGERK